MADRACWQARCAGQFRDLRGRHPALWPLAPRLLCGLAVAALVVALGCLGYWSGQFDERDGAARLENQLRAGYQRKLARCADLAALRARREQVAQSLARAQRQLPSKAEVAALLSDINRAGLGRRLRFELFKPGPPVVRDFYAELPIELKVSGAYHQLGGFAGDIALLPRIVVLHNLQLAAGKDGVVSLHAVAKTFRELDPDERAAQRMARAGKAAKP